MRLDDESYLARCYDLAKLSGRDARPNPRVGSVIVYNDRIIGEGYHQKYGMSHAEVNAVASVELEDRHLLPLSTIYVSLEPCHHYGKTPPCVDLILKERIQTVVIGIADPYEEVNSKSILKLKDNGIEVRISEAQQVPHELINEFYVNNILKRPYIQLKWAMSADHFVGSLDHQVHLTGKETNMYTHKLRGYTDGIMIGTNTALTDNPLLTQRNYAGPSPIRIVLDRTGRLPQSLSIYKDDLPTVTVTDLMTDINCMQKETISVDFSSETLISDLLASLFERGIRHLMVEGGATLLQSFIKQELWDEVVVISTSRVMYGGVKAPHIEGRMIAELIVGCDHIRIVKPISQRDYGRS